MPAAAPVVRWSVVLPVKGGPDAKSRLRSGAAGNSVDVTTAAGLAAGMSQDCLEAVRATPGVARAFVVTGDPATARTARALGADVVHQPADDPGLGAAVRRGLAAAGRGPTAVLLADLPALRPADLQEALDAAAAACRLGSRWVYVPDADDHGTVAVAALDPTALRPAFGPGSAAAHRAAGAGTLLLDLPRLRRDVDTVDDLWAAVALGVGHRTARTLAGVQATVLSWDSVAGDGEVVTDAGVRLPMAPDALQGSGLRHLRPGQRVTCTPVGPAGGVAVEATASAVTGVRIYGIAG